MSINLTPISGFPENLPEDQIIEDNFKEIIKKNYLKSWFNSIETPLVEREEILVSKWANDKEIYGIRRISWELSDDNKLGIRFDLTVPLARFVAQHNDKLVFPFKRFQIQKVYRWEKAQKWRYREFYQADIDIIWNWNLPLLADSEIISTIYNTLSDLNLPKFTININHREFLIWFLLCLWIWSKKLQEIISIIDKKDKIDSDKNNFPNTKDELNKILKNEIISEEIISFIILWKSWNLSEIESFVNNFFSWKTIDEDLKNMLEKWFNELKEIYNSVLALWVKKEYLKINPSISRWLDYYTWIVYETFIDWFEKMWSISSGWRYDNLTWNFIKNKYPWTGWSIWLSRLLAILAEIWQFKEKTKTLTKVLVLNLDKNYLKNYLEIINLLRKNQINTEFYLETAKIDKQIKYANNKWINLLVIMWETEIAKWIIWLKILDKREQIEVKIENLVTKINNL